MFAPNERALRILIALLAFALAIGFAVAATIAPAAADDIKEYEVFIGPAFPSGNPATGNDLLAGDGASVEARVTFLNPLENTATQKAGTFIVDFDILGTGDFEVTFVDQPVASGGQTWVLLSGQLDERVVISALDGEHRIGVTETVSVDVTVTVPLHQPSANNTYFLSTEGDQQAGGIVGGGNEFILSGPEPSITVGEGQIANCETNQGKCTTNADPAANGATGAAECLGCAKAGTLTVQSDDDFCNLAANDCKASWVADSTTGGAFFLIIQVAAEDLGGKITIIADQFDKDGNPTGESGVARNCRPPKRNFGCVDTDHPDYNKKAGTFPIRFPSVDPRGSYR